MQTHFTAEQLNDPAIARADSILPGLCSLWVLHGDLSDICSDRR